MAKHREINEGTRVMVRFNPLSPTMTQSVRKCDRSVRRVSKVVTLGVSSYYQLEGVVGKNNVPFSFTKDDLEVVR